MHRSNIARCLVIAFIVALVALASGCVSPDAPGNSPGATDAATPSSSNAGEVRLDATLTGAAIGGVVPKGSAEFDIAARGAVTFSISVADVNLPNGTVLSVFVNIGGTRVAMGTMKLRLVGGAPGNASLTVKK